MDPAHQHGLPRGIGTLYDKLLLAFDSADRGRMGSVVLEVTPPAGQPLRFEVPSDVAVVLYDVFHLLSSGAGVLVVPARQDVTTSQAATMLGLSRTQLVRLLDSGAIPFRKVGKHRRVRLVDVMAYRRRQEEDARTQAAMLRLDIADTTRPVG
jgi:excisionase family DNA binding protein